MDPVPLMPLESSSSAQAAQILLDIANANLSISSPSLPEYGALPVAAIVSLNTLALFVRDEYQVEGPLRLSFNSMVHPWQDVSPKSFFLLPAFMPTEGRMMSMEFLNSSQVQIWQLRGKPTSAITYAMLVGVTGNGQLPLIGLSIGDRVSVATPTCFVSVIEELEDVTARLAAAWDVKEKRNRQDGTFHEDHLSKRMRGSLQGDLGVQSQGEKLNSKLMLIDLEGVIHQEGYGGEGEGVGGGVQGV